MMKSFLRIRIILVVAAGVSVFILLQLALVASGTAAPLASSGTAPALQAGNYGGDFRFATYEPTSLDPAHAEWDVANWTVVAQIFEGLTKWDDDFEPLPAVAHSWESSDAVHWSFNIRSGARFHNGRQITAQDVVYSWKRVATSGNDWYEYLLGPALDPVTDTVTTVGTDTLQVTLNYPYASLPLLLASSPMSIVPSETVGTIATSPVGSGPFQFGSWTEGDSIVLAYNEDYYDGRPYLDSITYQFYEDESQMYADYLLGNLDLSPVPAASITDVVGSPDAIFVTRLSFRYYGTKVDVPPLDDVRVRRALNYAVDKQDIVDNVYPAYEYAVPAQGPVPPGMQGYDPPVESYPYNPTLALDLLADAGWTDTNFDGILDDGAGTDLELNLWYHDRPGEPALLQEAVANALADHFRDIGGSGLGATVVISFENWAEYLNNIDQYPMYSLQWTADYPDPYNFLQPHFGTDGSVNHTNYSDPQVDAWLDESLETLDLAARQEVYRNIETQVQEDAPFINLAYGRGGMVYIKGVDVLGLVVSPAGLDAVQMEKVQLFFQTHDVELQSILYPKTSVAMEAIVPTAKVRNAGSSSETNVPVHCRILQDGTLEVYNETANIASLSPFATQVVVFPNWTPSSAGSYTFEFTTELPGDGDPSNDQETQGVAVTATAFYDAYTRDNNTDDGSVPTLDWWQSPDIVVRHQDDSIRYHEDPILGQTNYVYVRVRNIGDATISDGSVNVYWHGPSSAIICSSWGLINPSPIPVGTLAPGQSKWVKTTWVPPIEGHTCLFSRVWSGEDPVTFECDVPWDNNIAQRNVEVVESASGLLGSLAQAGQTSVLFEVTNVRDLPASVDLIVERGTFPADGGLVLEFSNDLFSRWLAETGGTLQGGAIIPSTTQISVTHPISAAVLGLPMGVRETQQATMYLAAQPGVEFALHVTERIEGTIMGGITYYTEIPSTIYLPLVLKNYGL